MLSLSSGFQMRQRSLDLFTFLFTLIFGFGVPGTRRLQALWGSYLTAAPRKISKTSFYEWLTKPTLVPFLEAVIVRVMERFSTTAGARLGSALEGFRDLFSVDSTTIHLHEHLAKVFPGTRKNSSPAAAKLHVVQKASGGGIHSAKITSGVTADLRGTKFGSWVRGALVLLDLGYFSYQDFGTITRHGGFFISRLRSGANPRILGSNTAHRGRKVPIEGCRLKDVLPRLKRRIIDLQVVVGSGSKKLELRLVGVWDPDEKQYHLYLTNVRTDQLSAVQIAETYRLRWQVEILFRELKSIHRLEEIPGENPVLARAMILSSVLSALVTRRLVANLLRCLNLDPEHLPHEQSARIVQVVAPLLLLTAVAPGSVARSLDEAAGRAMRTMACTLASVRDNLLSQLQCLQLRPELESLLECGSTC